jgi:hypothetical protein
LDEDPSEPSQVDVTAMFDGTPFTPKFGLAVETYSDTGPDPVLILFSTMELDCTNYRDVVFGTPGYGASILLPSTSPGTYGPDATIGVFEIRNGGSSRVEDSSGSTTLSKGGALRVAGSVTFSTDDYLDAQGITSVEGTFDVVRCFE